ncbi:MAG TPA: hypothetical protein VF392_07935 [Terracidiphilus sp.]
MINQPLAPPIEDTPNQAPVPSPAPGDLPPPVISTPADNTTKTDTTKPAEGEPKPPVHHKKPAPKPVQQASNGETPSVSAIGQLSSGDGSDLRSQTDASIQSTDRALKQITRPLSDTEKKTAAQITEFLKQARSALGSGDVDGAHTLALKAKVLLDQLTK